MKLNAFGREVDEGQREREWFDGALFFFKYYKNIRDLIPIGIDRARNSLFTLFSYFFNPLYNLMNAKLALLFALLFAASLCLNMRV